MASTPCTPPKFEVPLKDKTVLTGKGVKLKCRVLCDSQPQVDFPLKQSMLGIIKQVIFFDLSSLNRILRLCN